MVRATSLHQLAASEIVGSMPASPQLYAGEAPIISDSAVALEDIKLWQLLALTPTGVRPFKWVASGDPTNDDPQTAVISAVAVVAGKRCGYYDAGKYNYEVIVFPDALTDVANPISKLPLIKAEFHGTMLHFGHLVG